MACKDCSFRQYWEKRPRSLLGRMWKLHTHFCPGWFRYLHSLSSEERAELERFLRTHGRR